MRGELHREKSQVRVQRVDRFVRWVRELDVARKGNTVSQCPTKSLPSLSMTSVGGSVTVLYSYVCSSLSVILFVFKVKVTVGTKNHQYLNGALDREISVIFRNFFASRSRRSTIGVKIGQKSHLSENFQSFARASWNDFPFHFLFYSQFFCKITKS